MNERIRIQPAKKPIPDPSKAKVKTWYATDSDIEKWNREADQIKKEAEEAWLRHPCHPNNLGNP